MGARAGLMTAAATAGRCAVLSLLLACGASDREAPDAGDFELAKPAANSGDAQVGVAGVRLPDRVARRSAFFSSDFVISWPSR